MGFLSKLKKKVKKALGKTGTKLAFGVEPELGAAVGALIATGGATALASAGASQLAGASAAQAAPQAQGFDLGSFVGHLGQVAQQTIGSAIESKLGSLAANAKDKLVKQAAGAGFEGSAAGTAGAPVGGVVLKGVPDDGGLAPQALPAWAIPAAIGGVALLLVASGRRG